MKKAFLFFLKIAFILPCFIILSAHGNKKKNGNQTPFITLHKILNDIKNSDKQLFQEKAFYCLWEKLENIARKKDGGIYSKESIENFIRYCEKELKVLDRAPKKLASNTHKDLLILVRDDLKNALNPCFLKKEKMKCQICFESINSKKELYLKLDCCKEAYFHEKCLIPWFAKHRFDKDDVYEKCPLCRATIKPYIKFLLQKSPLYKKLYEKEMISLGRMEILSELGNYFRALEEYETIHENDSTDSDDSLSLNELTNFAEFSY